MKKLVRYFNNLFILHPDDPFGELGKSRYERLKRTLVILIATLSLVPMLISVSISYVWLQGLLEEEFRDKIRWEIESTKNAVEFFMDVKLSGLRSLAYGHTYAQLSNQAVITDIFTKFKREFIEIVDLGVIDADGIQKSYAGPYNLRNKDYSGHEWFHRVSARGIYVSDVFLGYRGLPHFVIAVKKEVPDRETFWILRASINMDTLDRFLTMIDTEEGDDVFIMNRDGVLQTGSRYHGEVLERFAPPVSLPQRGVSVIKFEDHDGRESMLGYSYIRNAPWILCVVKKTTRHPRLATMFRGGFIAIILTSLIVVFVIAVRMSRVIVNWIRDADQKREVAISEAEHAGKLASIGRLAAGVAHEINNPLAIINEKAGLIKDILELSRDHPQAEKLLTLSEGIMGNVKRSRAITHRLLGFARRMDMSPEEIDVNDLVKEVIGFLEKEILFRDVQLRMDLVESLPRIRSDRGQLQQVILNIVNNAIDAVDAGGIIEIATALKEHERVSVTISDNGAGIPKERLKHIFEPFFTTKEKGRGTGLGLFISYGIIRKLGGKLSVESEVGKGTVFTIELPLLPEEQRGGSK